MKTTKNIPALRFPEFEGEWNQIALGKITDLITKGTTPKFFSDSGINFIRIESLDGIKIIVQKCLYISNHAHNKELARSILKEGDLLFAIAGATIGKVAIVTKDILPANTNQALAIIRINKRHDIHFVLYVLSSKRMKNYIFQSLSVGAQPNLNLKQISDFDFLIPQKPEQQKIASFLSSVDQRIHLLSQKKEKLEQYKKGLMQRIFSQQLRFRDENGKYYPEWEVLRFNECFERVTRKNKINNNNILTISAQNGLINQLDFFNNTVASKDLSNYYLLKRGEFAYNKSYSKGYPLGATKRLTMYEMGVVSVLYICFKCKSHVNSEFMEHYFESGIHNRYLYKIAQEGARNHGLLNMSVEDYFNTSVYLPSISEQKKIATFLSSIDDKINHINSQIELTRKWKQGLLQKMFV